MIRPVLRFPDRRLKQPAVRLGRVGPAARRLAVDLQETARSHPRTVGLAATQLGVMWRMVYIDLTDHPKVDAPVGPLWLVDPQVVDHDGWEVGREGCLSLPDITADVGRPHRATVHALDLDGRPVTHEVEGFTARVFLHEIDHLDGVLILDRVTSLARDVFARAGGQRRSRAESRVQRAAALARVAHAGQRDGGRPYAQHLEEVVDVLAEAGVDDPGLRAAAWLHDCVEDTPVAVADLVPDYGARVAALVDALTVYPGPDGAPDHEASWRRIAAEPGAVAVKLADRIARARSHPDRVPRYRGQQPALRAALADADRGVVDAAVIARMWTELDAALAP